MTEPTEYEPEESVELLAKLRLLQQQMAASTSTDASRLSQANELLERLRELGVTPGPWHRVA